MRHKLVCAAVVVLVLGLASGQSFQDTRVQRNCRFGPTLVGNSTACVSDDDAKRWVSWEYTEDQNPTTLRLLFYPSLSNLTGSVTFQAYIKELGAVNIANGSSVAFSTFAIQTIIADSVKSPSAYQKTAKNVTSLILGTTELQAVVPIADLKAKTAYTFNVYASNGTHSSSYLGGMAYTVRGSYVPDPNLWVVLPLLLSFGVFLLGFICLFWGCLDGMDWGDDDEKKQFIMVALAIFLLWCIPFFFGGLFGLYLNDVDQVQNNWFEGVCTQTSTGGAATAGRPFEMVVIGQGEFENDVSFAFDPYGPDDDGTDDALTVGDFIRTAPPVGQWNTLACFYDQDYNVLRQTISFNIGGDVTMMVFAGAGIGTLFAYVFERCAHRS
jgi:hypothetical protein